MTRGLPILAAACWLATVGGCRIEERIPESARTTAPPDTTAVLAVLRSYYRDFSARDWNAFQSHFWTGADITTVWQPPGDSARRVDVMPVPEFVRRAPEGPGSRAIFEEQMQSARIVVRHDLASAWVRYRARFGDPGDVQEWEGHDLFTLMRLEGEWRIVELAFTPEPGGTP